MPLACRSFPIHSPSNTWGPAPTPGRERGVDGVKVRKAPHDEGEEVPGRARALRRHPTQFGRDRKKIEEHVWTNSPISWYRYVAMRRSNNSRSRISSTPLGRRCNTQATSSLLQPP